MDLLIDIGNTRIKWVSRASGVFAEAGEANHRKDTAGAIAALLAAQTEPPERVLASNVAGERLGRELSEAVQQQWGVPVNFAQTKGEADGLMNGYEHHRSLGVDRWLALAAAFASAKQALCVVDAGTAVTVDLVSAKGQHLGGYIVPGLDLMRSSLGAETGDLERLAASSGGMATDAPPEPGRATAAAISGGTLAMLCSLVNQCVADIEASDQDVSLILTGGDADRLQPYLSAKAEIRPHLVLEGLAMYEFDNTPD